MKSPNLSEEKKLWKKGYKKVACLDESGRGPLAGPVVAAAVMIKNLKFEARNSKQIRNSKFQFSKQFGIWNLRHWDLFRISNLGFRILKLQDSKKLSPKMREIFYEVLIRNSGIEWGTGRVSEKVIDRINILEATKLAMKRAVKNLEKKYSPADFLILDGKMKLNLKTSQKAIIKADEKVFSCACSSVIAKVIRDRIMKRYHKKYPRYGFDKHKGYGTKLHLKMLKKYGPCKIHRETFRPVLKISNIRYQISKIQIKNQKF